MTDLSTLAALTGGDLVGTGEVEVEDVTHDSRDAGPGVMFVAVRGASFDGHGFVEQAASRGAAAVCVETVQSVELPQLVVADTRRALPHLAAEVHGHPSRSLRMVGVTGTNGKTTVCFMVEAIAGQAGVSAARIGTLGAASGGRDLPLARTTPEASDLQRLLARVRDDRVDVVSMEVSSHALALHRVDAIDFAVGAFTNLSVDHLDFHPDLEAYFEAKASLFERARDKVIHVGPWGDRLAERHPDALLVGPGTGVSADDVEAGPDGSRFTLSTPAGRIAVHLPMAGEFNVDNAVVAAGCALALGIGLEEIARGLGSMPRVRGRMERVDGGRSFGVYVDYAHTPDGIANAITAARRFTEGRVIAVFGAGGDRDRSKRPAMGAAAARADLVWVTSDNPRSEPPLAIIEEVVAGLAGHRQTVVEPDRRSAIAAALDAALPGDAVLILGKGHEQGQDLGGVVVPFDDRTVVQELLERVGR